MFAISENDFTRAGCNLQKNIPIYLKFALQMNLALIEVSMLYKLQLRFKLGIMH